MREQRRKKKKTMCVFGVCVCVILLYVVVLNYGSFGPNLLKAFFPFLRHHCFSLALSTILKFVFVCIVCVFFVIFCHRRLCVYFFLLSKTPKTKKNAHTRNQKKANWKWCSLPSAHTNDAREMWHTKVKNMIKSKNRRQQRRWRRRW